MDNRLKPEHFELLYAAIIAAGGKAGTAHQVHRTARTAFGEAHGREVITKNPVALAKAPRLDEEEVEPFEVKEIQRLITAALGRRNSARFVLALAIGTRQGESIGLNDTTRTLTIARQLQRQTWEHGCDDSHNCGAKHHKTRPCRDSCKRHKRKPCPPPCSPDCISHARWCATRHGGGLLEVDVKSLAGRRGIVLPDQLYTLLVQHRAEQDRERELAADPWADEGWMFAQPNGRALDPRRTWPSGKPCSLTLGCGTRGCTTPGTRPRRCCCCSKCRNAPSWSSWGWSNSSMAKRYQHVTAVLRGNIAKRLDGFLWSSE